MTKLPLGSFAMLALASFMLAGCSTHRAQDTLLAPDGVGETTRLTPRQAAPRITASARLMLICNEVPEAKDALAFLADGAGLRAGTVILTKAQADAALAELARFTGKAAQSSPTVSMTVGERIPVLAKEPIRSARDEGLRLISVGGNEMDMTHEVPVDLDLMVLAYDAPDIQFGVTIHTTMLEGFVEYGSEEAKSMAVSVPRGFYIPVFSERSLEVIGQMQSGQTMVLQCDANNRVAPADKTLPPALIPSDGEIVLIFVTADV